MCFLGPFPTLQVCLKKMRELNFLKKSPVAQNGLFLPCFRPKELIGSISAKLSFLMKIERTLICLNHWVCSIKVFSSSPSLNFRVLENLKCCTFHRLKPVTGTVHNISREILYSINSDKNQIGSSQKWIQQPCHIYLR